MSRRISYWKNGDFSTAICPPNVRISRLHEAAKILAKREADLGGGGGPGGLTPETKMFIPENGWFPRFPLLKKEIPIGNHHFWGGRGLLVLGSVFFVDSLWSMQEVVQK